MQASTWQHMPRGDTKVVIWFWNFKFELPHLPLQHLPPRVMLDSPLGMSCVEEKLVCPSSHCQVSYWLLGFSVFGKVGSFWWWLPLAGDDCWSTRSPSTSTTKTSFLCMLLPRLPIIKAEQRIRASA